MSAKGGQKEGMGGQRPKSRAKEGHGRAPSQKQGSLAAMILMQCKKPKSKRPNGVKMAPRLKSVFFGSKIFVFDCQNVLLFYPFTINCLCISFLSYLWVSDDPSILVTRKKTPKGLANLLIF